jgi:hypothetical protein
LLSPAKFLLFRAVSPRAALAIDVLVLFTPVRYRPLMATDSRNDPANFRPADPADLKESLAFALRFEGKKRRHDADDYMARIVADLLVAHVIAFAGVV